MAPVRWTVLVLGAEGVVCAWSAAGVMFAEEITASGVAGWSTFGLAGLILAWLFLKHLPDKDKQIKEMLTEQQKSLSEKDGRVKELIIQHQGSISDKDRQIERMLATKNEQLKILTESGTAQIKTMVEANSVQARMMHDENRGSLERVIKHCEEETKSGHEVLLQHLRQLSDVIEDLGVDIRETNRDRLSNPTQHQIRGRKHKGPLQSPPPGGQDDTVGPA